jgi:hypothetical protein
MTGLDVIACARGMLDTPWRHQGRMPGVALDCAGLIICVGRSLGLLPADFDVNGYRRSPDGSMLRFCRAHLLEIGDLEIGAVLVVSMVNEPQHLGIVADYRHGGFSLVHAASAAERVVETRLMFARNFVRRGVFRLPGVVA